MSDAYQSNAKEMAQSKLEHKVEDIRQIENIMTEKQKQISSTKSDLDEIHQQILDLAEKEDEQRVILEGMLEKSKRKITILTEQKKDSKSSIDKLEYENETLQKDLKRSDESLKEDAVAA